MHQRAISTGMGAWRPGLPVLGVVLALIAGGLFSLATGGRSDVGLWQLWAPEGIAVTVVYDIRAPRTLAAALLGVNLGLAGLALQAVTRNALASPAILGINQGAALGLTLGLVVPGFAGLSLNLLAVTGAGMAGFLTFTIAGGLRGRIDPLRLILGGIAVGAFSYAIVRFAFTLDDDIARSVVRWTVGDIGDIRWPASLHLAYVALPGGLACWALAHRFNLLALGQDSAQALGSDPRVTLFLGVSIAAILAGVSVTVAGPIAFTGLVVPHLARLLFGSDHRRLVPMSALIGAALMLVADGLSKTVTAPIEAPIGVIAALLGAPWFLIQTLRAKDLV